MELTILSVCLITYNHNNFIRQTIESLLMQKTSFPFMIVIGEDYSTDDTADIVMEYVNKYPRIIKAICNSQNIGAMANLIKTLQECEGKYIAYCEGDDYWTDPYKLQKQVDFLEANPECSLCCHMVGRINCENGVEEMSDLINENRYLTNEEIILAHGMKTPTLSYLFRNQHIKNLPIWVQKAPIGDIPLVYYLMMNGKVFCFKDKMGIYRINSPNSWSVSQRKSSLLKTFKFRIKYDAFIQAFNEYSNCRYKKELALSDAHRSRLKLLFIHYMVFLYRLFY